MAVVVWSSPTVLLALGTQGFCTVNRKYVYRCYIYKEKCFHSHGVYLGLRFANMSHFKTLENDSMFIISNVK